MDQATASERSTITKAMDVIPTTTTTADTIGDTQSPIEHRLDKVDGQDGDTEQGQEEDETEDDGDQLNLDSYQPASEEILAKLLTQAEFYFSDSNVLKDKFLMKNIQKIKAAMST